MSLKLPIYMDYNATTPVDQRVVEAMLPYFTEHFGNAASLDHEFGSVAQEAVTRARQQIAELISAKADDIIFTSGATESDNIALFGIAESYADKGDHIITSAIEHKAILDTAQHLEQLGKSVTYLPVDQYGQVNPEAVRQVITPRTVLISIMAANNEIGTVTALKEIGAIAQEHNVIFHTDGAQYVGHLPLDVSELKIDLLSISAHKMYGPKGIGALYIRPTNPPLKVAPVIYGGGHERGVRSGTLNVPAIVGFGVAATLCQEELPTEEPRLRNLTLRMFAEISEAVKGVELNGHPTQRLPHNLNLSFKGIRSKPFIKALKNIAISAGSACNAASTKPSHVVSALGFDEERAYSSLRYSLGRYTTEEEVDYAISTTIKMTKLLKQFF